MPNVAMISGSANLSIHWPSEARVITRTVSISNVEPQRLIRSVLPHAKRETDDDERPRHPLSGHAPTIIRSGHLGEEVSAEPWIELVLRATLRSL